MLVTLFANAMYAEWASVRCHYIIELAVLHEHFEHLKIFLTDTTVIEHAHLEAFGQKMALNCLEQDHLARSKHATPTSIRVVT